MTAEFVVFIIKKDQTLDVLVHGWQSPALPWRAGAGMGMQLCQGLLWSSQKVALC